ncbi:LysR family transcriptional regulator [Arthrobacter mangrovi]|uniref:LysR family transcriptional regulator n=1 Tax=Arthrobacter mangrovi TaxID=2966350 RepID=A0ABQ5MZV8_9MICC|nr:LysR family transcriptional regulator [Arthrobacter mangrovi]GLB69498.1 LysR family transcriptional regulator [Arthrobacter mangrovi]
MDRRQLEIFLSVVENESISRAAEALHLAQPSVSQAIKQLEREVRGELFLRSTRGVRPTAAGEALIEPARQVLRDLSVALESVGHVLGLRGGTLDIVSVPALAIDPLASFVGSYRRSFPDVQVRVIDPPDVSDAPAYVRSGRCEIGLVEDMTPEPELCIHELAGQEIVLVLPPGAAVGSGPVSWEDLSLFEFVTSPPGRSVSRSKLEQIFSRTGKQLRVCVESDHRTAIADFVMAGAGAALLRRPISEPLAAQGARVRPLNPPLLHQVTLVHRRRSLSPAARAFVGLATKGTGTCTA